MDTPLLVWSVEKLLEKLDARTLSFKVAEKELVSASLAFSSGESSIWAIILSSVFESISKSGATALSRSKKPVRYEYLKSRIVNRWGDYSLINIVTTSFEEALGILKQKEAESSALQRQMKQNQKKRSWSLSEESVFVILTDLLTLSFPQQLAICSALAQSLMESLKSVGLRCISLLLKKLMLVSRGVSTSESEHADLSFFAMPEVILKDIDLKKFPGFYLNSLVLAVQSAKNDETLDFTLDKLELFSDRTSGLDFAALFLSQRDQVAISSISPNEAVDFDFNNEEHDTSRYLGEMLLEVGPMVTEKVEDLVKLFSSMLGASNIAESQAPSQIGVNERDVAFILMALLKTASSELRDEDNATESALQSSFSYLCQIDNLRNADKQSLAKVLDKETDASFRRISCLADLWAPDVFVKAMIKLKKEKGLFNVAKVLQTMDSKSFSPELCQSEDSLRWMFSVLSELNVKDKKVDVTDLFTRKWNNKPIQLAFLKYLTSHTDTEEGIDFFVKGQKKVFEQKETTKLIVSLSLFGYYKEAREVFMKLFLAMPMVREKVLLNLIGETDSVDEDEFGEVDVLGPAKNSKTKRFAPLRVELIGQLLSLCLRSKNLQLLRKAWSSNGKEFVTRFFFRKYIDNREMLAVLVSTVKASPDALDFISSVKIVGEQVAVFVLDFVCSALPVSPNADETTELSIEAWLEKRLQTRKRSDPWFRFIRQSVQFMLARFPGSSNVSKGVYPALESKICLLFIEKVGKIVDSLSEQELGEKDLIEVKNVLQVCKNKLGSVSSAPSTARVDGARSPVPGVSRESSLNANYTREQVEKEANEIFEAIFTGKSPIMEALALLRRYKFSGSSFEQEVFDSAVDSLLDEFKFLEKYPERALRITGVVLGLMIKHELISDTRLSVALSSILQGLRSPSSSKQFRFGMYALDQFKSRLPMMLEFAAQIVGIAPLRQEMPEIIRQVGLLLARSPTPSALPPSVPLSRVLQQNQGPAQKAAVNSNLPSPEVVKKMKKELEEELDLCSSFPLRGTEGPEDYMVLCGKIDDIIPVSEQDMGEPSSPGSQVEDKLLFIINNLSKSNVVEKALEADKELKRSDGLWKWVAGYLVSHRVSRQPNFHEVYATFLDALSDSRLEREVRLRTLIAVKRKLKSQALVGSSSERSVVKNLGNWLGRVTIGKSRPLLQRELDLRELILDAFERGWLIAVMPFLAKILEHARSQNNLTADSEQYDFQVFTGDSPWVRGMIRCLAELYNVQDLKLNLKFEIEVLCKELGIKVKDIKPTKLLHRRKKPKLEGNPDFSLKDETKMMERQRAQDRELTQRRQKIQQQLERLQRTETPSPALRTGPQSPRPARLEQPIPNLASYVSVKPTTRLFQQIPALKKVVPAAVDRAIREVIQPVAERACSIASSTARELIKKDFAMEWDEKKLRMAAHKSVASLAASLAMVTCRESLRGSLEMYLRQILTQAIKSSESLSEAVDPEMLEEAVSDSCDSNLDLGTKLIEKAAVEKAIREVDASLESLYSIRLRSREQTGKKYFDLAAYSNGQRFPADLPAILRPRPKETGLDVHFLRVYDAFTMPNTGAAQQPTAAPKRQSPSTDTRMAAAVEEWKSILAQIDIVVQEISASGSVSPSVHQEVSMLIKRLQQVGKAVAGAPNKDETVGMFVHRMFQRVFEAATQPNSSTVAQKFRSQVQFALLESFVGMCENFNVRKKLAEWIFATKLESRLNRYVTLGLLRSKLVLIADFDVVMAKVLDSEATLANVSFALDIVRASLGKKLATVSEFAHTLDLLNRLQHRMQLPEIAQVLDEVRQMSRSTSTIPLNGKRTDASDHLAFLRAQLNEKKKDNPAGFFLRSDESATLRKQVAKFLHAWMQLYNSQGDIFSPGTHQGKYQAYLTSLQQHGALSGEENTDTFFRLCAELVIESALTNAKPVDPQTGKTLLSYAATDALSKLILLLVKYAKATAKTRLARKVLDIVADIFVREVNSRSKRNIPETIDQRPYFRLFRKLMDDLSSLYEVEKLGEEGKQDMLRQFAEVYHTKLQPKVAPGFTFAWMRLICQKNFIFELIGCSLEAEKPTSEACALSLLEDLFCFLSPYVEQGDGQKIPQPLKELYIATLRLFFVILHDFPGFLAANYMALLNMIPVTCIQLRNIVLSAFPEGMQLPEPLNFACGSDKLSEMKLVPATSKECLEYLQSRSELKSLLEKSLKRFETESVSSFIELLTLKENDQERFNPNNGASSYNLRLMTCMVSILGDHAAKNAVKDGNLDGSLSSNGSSCYDSYPSLKIVFALIKEFNEDGRYFFISTMANFLRFPNAHTHFFATLFFKLFLEAEEEVVQEQICRVLLERLIVHRPHPWGLVVVLSELIKNDKFGFWNRKYINASPEVASIFDSVSKSLLKTN